MSDGAAPTTPRRRARQQPPEPPLYVTFAEAGRLLGLSPRTIRRLTDKGELRSRHILTAHRVERASIDDYVERLSRAG